MNSLWRFFSGLFKPVEHCSCCPKVATGFYSIQGVCSGMYALLCNECLERYCSNLSVEILADVEVEAHKRRIALKGASE